MKTFLRILFMLLLAADLYGQTGGRVADWEKGILSDEQVSAAEFKNDLLKYDFAPLWISNEKWGDLGFIGDDYQRLRMRILSVVKDKNNPGTYLVTGKSMVKNNVSRFSGTIKLRTARTLKKVSWGVDDEFKDAGIKNAGLIFADYDLAEDKKQTGSGVFKGTLLTYWYIDKNDKLRYNDIDSAADGYSNNQFAGTWQSYQTGAVKTANWGDDRIPLSGDLDMGAGEFSPAEKYRKFDWQSYVDAYFSGNKKALAEERRKWWK